MSRINLLDKEIYELIAAGEVVERPSSVVKELVENSIDAGATNITIEIKGGGIGYIRIADNGRGINKEDVPKAFLRHATSKINEKTDLEAIYTLGFRGEALSSIAAVSKIQIITKTKDDSHGWSYELPADKTDLVPIGAPDGTTIIISDLFYNTPARMKFLRSDVAEGNAVSQIVEKIALSHPFIAFTFIRDTKTRLQTSGNGDLLAVIAKIYNNETANRMLEVNYTFENAVKVHGYVGDPSTTKPSRAYQTFFVNDRYVRTATASVATGEAFKGKIMTGKFPIAILFIEIDPTKTDINVHPAKTEVRFESDKPIYNGVYFAVKNALTKNIEPIVNSSINTDEINIVEPAISQDSEPSITELFSNTSVNKSKAKNYILDIEVDPQPKQQDFYNTQKHNSGNNPTEPMEMRSRSQSISKDTDFVAAIALSNQEAEQGTQSYDESPQLRLIGELLDTYILLESSNKELILIDKHAAHERIIYEEIKNQSEGGLSQVLLSSVSVALEKDEYTILLENIDQVFKLGFLIEDFGTGTVIVRETPANLSSEDISFLLSEIANKLLENRRDLTPEALNQLHYSIACKAALRAGDKTEGIELMEIVRNLENNLEITHCPHGRPVSVKMSKKEIEKMFGRLI